MAPICQLCEGELIKGTMASASISVWEKAAPQLHPWCWTIQFHPLPNIHGAFKLLSQHWSSERLCQLRGPTRHTAVVQTFVSDSTLQRRKPVLLRKMTAFKSGLVNKQDEPGVARSIVPGSKRSGIWSKQTNKLTMMETYQRDIRTNWKSHQWPSLIIWLTRQMTGLETKV